MSRNIAILVSALLVSAVMAGPASAEVLILDTFNASDGSAIDGRTPSASPNIDVPGGAYQAAASNSFWEIHGGKVQIQSGAADMGPDVADYIDISSYNSNTVLTISANLRYDNESGDPSANGAALGYWSTAGGANGLTDFTGVALGLSGGGDWELELMSGATFHVTSVIDLTTLIPAFDGTAFHLLTYSVDTTTGAIATLSLDGTPYVFLSTGDPFSIANTKLAGLGLHGVTAADTGAFDNFELSVPEPASIGLLAMGGLALLGVRRRRRCEFAGSASPIDG